MNLYLSWKHYLRLHPFCEEFNQNAEKIQELTDPTEPNESYHKLQEYNSLVCLTKTPFTNEIQATFLHDRVKEAFKNDATNYLALCGFGTKARAVKLNPHLIFSRSPQAQKVPDFKSFMDCDNLDKVNNLKAGNKKEKIESFAILPPFLTEELFENDNMEANNLLLKFIGKIKDLREPEIREENNDSTSGLQLDLEDIGNISYEEEEDEEKHEKDNEKKEPNWEFEEKAFHKPLIFLWGVINESKFIPGTPLTICNKVSTKKWEDAKHKEHIKNRPDPVQQEIPQSFGFENMTSELKELNNNLTAAKLSPIKVKDDEDDRDGYKKFRKLSRVSRNTLTLFTMTEDHGPEDIPELTPAPGMLECLAGCNPYDVQENLHHHLNNNGNVAYIQRSVCAALWKGFITSSDPKSINNLTPFATYGNVPENNGLDAKTLLKLAMKEKHERYDKEDLELLTELKITIPRDFHSYMHMLRNMEFLCFFLAGEDSLVRKTWQSAVEHAKKNEKLYTDQGDADEIFYCSTMYDFHRRFHTYLQSCAFGKYEKLKLRQLDFSHIYDDIEEDRYSIRSPGFIKKRAAEKTTQNNNDSDPKVPPKKKPRKDRNANRGEKVNNNDFDQTLKAPSPLTYEQIFHPKNRGKTPAPTHTDGTIICNNFHHHGYCWEKGCRYSASHAKKLSEAEKQERRKYLTDLVSKYNMENNVQNAVVPGGNPPAQNGTNRG